MNLKDQLLEDMKNALRNRETLKLSVLRLLISQIKQIEIDERRQVNEIDIINILTLNIKQRHESISQFEKGNRDDLVKKETEEISIIQKYLPEALTDDEVKALVEESIQEAKPAGIKDLGKVMKIIIPKTKGRADSAKISAIVKQRLSE
ncbi:GatB/YqeY domain-containing protein [Candidatus Desantisbacteria bacterium]|nr:GatB/YqeY domain-containing protein [Candidatus Desantisbacteria bacterium]